MSSTHRMIQHLAPCAKASVLVIHKGLAHLDDVWIRMKRQST